MKALIILITSLLSSTVGKAQTAANERMNIVYGGHILNEISISVPDYPCNLIIVKADTGELTPFGDCGHYSYSPPSSDCRSVTFSEYINSNEGLKKVGETKFRIQQNSPLEASIARKRNTDITINELKDDQFIFVNFPDYFVCGEVWVDSFNYIIVRNNKPLYSGQNKGFRFDKNLKMYISYLHKGDQIVFYDIYAKKMQFAPFELKIVTE